MGRPLHCGLKLRVELSFEAAQERFQRARAVVLSIASKQHILRLIDTGGEVRRAPLVGVEFLHEPAMGATDLFRARTRLKAKDLISFLLGHFAGSRWAAPRCRIALCVFTPLGMPAVKIRCQ